MISPPKVKEQTLNNDRDRTLCSVAVVRFWVQVEARGAASPSFQPQIEEPTGHRHIDDVPQGAAERELEERLKEQRQRHESPRPVVARPVEGIDCKQGKSTCRDEANENVEAVGQRQEAGDEQGGQSRQEDLGEGEFHQC